MINSCHFNAYFGGRLTRCIFSHSIICPNKLNLRFNSTNSSLDHSTEIDDIESQDLLKDVLQYNQLDVAGHQQMDAIVIMPRQKMGLHKKDKERGQALLEETITLVHSIPGWKVIGSHMISTSRVHSRLLFGSSNLDHLRQYVRSTQANALVFSLSHFTPVQHHYLQNYFQIEIYDRFSIVLKIFRERASKKESKLQLALAELNYVKQNLHCLKECEFSEFTLSQSFGGGFDTYYQIKKRWIQEREAKIKKALQKVEKDYELKKTHRINFKIPTVAVVGYTNSGKTSLIKALTHDSRLIPEDKLFATLDVSTHPANLPSNLKALFIDTIGFISEIPTSLINCFKSTLVEICTADLLVHITDSSHPERLVQIDTVNSTLREINVPEKLLSSMIVVSNKVDKLNDKNVDCQSILPVSATERIGLDELKQRIENDLIINTNRKMFRIRVPNGGEEYQWLYKEAPIVECKPDQDPNYIIMKVIVTKSTFGKFKKLFDN